MIGPRYRLQENFYYLFLDWATVWAQIVAWLTGFTGARRAGFRVNNKIRLINRLGSDRPTGQVWV